MRVILSLVLLGALATSCSVDAGAGPRDGDGTDVVASFYPLEFAVARIGGGGVSVSNLTPAGVEPHDLELTSDDLEAIATADVVVHLGGGFQPGVEEAVGSEATGITVDARSASRSGDAALDEELAADPHIWLDPARFADTVAPIADALVEVEPARTQAVEANAEILVAELDALDADFRRGLASCDSRVVITNHAAFGHLAGAYGLEQVSISGVTPESEPDPARIADIAELANSEGVTTIFAEDLVSPEIAETLASEAGVATAVLSPLEGLTEEQIAGGYTYLSVMRQNLEVLRDGLGCR